MKLYTAFRSSAAFRCASAQSEGVAYDPALCTCRGEHRKPEFAAINPQALDPRSRPTACASCNRSHHRVSGGDAPDSAAAPRTRPGVRACARFAAVACEIHPSQSPVLRISTRIRPERRAGQRLVRTGLPTLPELEAERARHGGPFCHGARRPWPIAAWCRSVQRAALQCDTSPTRR